MRILVNALSVTNPSGRHVLLGHLARCAAWAADRHAFTFLYHDANADLRRDLGANVAWHRAPALCGQWAGRTAWEWTALRSVIRAQRAEGVFSPAGTAIPICPVPQLVFCQNPWCLTPGLARTLADRVKAAVQRGAYRSAVRRAALMVFNSRFMLEAYVRNAGREPRAFLIAHQGVDDATFAAARGDVPRVSGQIVSVSVMARHKNVETLLRALVVLRGLGATGARLKLAGGWPDPAYRREMESLAGTLGVRDAVAFLGHVSRDELHRLYGESMAFALMSRCESFGIPAVEAHAFGTPVVGAACGAVPEIVGDGGWLLTPDDAQGAAQALFTLLTDATAWQACSARARANAERFRWNRCARAMLAAFDRLASEAAS